MKRLLIFPMTSRAFIGSVCFALGIAFLLFFFLAPSPPVYTKLGTERGEVMGIFPARSRFRASEAPISVKLEDGSVDYLEGFDAAENFSRKKC